MILLPVETALHPVLDDRFGQRARRARRGGHHGRDGSAPAVACRRPRHDMGGPGRVVGSTPRVRRQRAWRLRVACSRTRPAPPALRRSRARTAGLVRATRPVDTSPLLGRRPSPALRARQRRRRVALRAGVAGLPGFAATGGHQSGRSRRVHRREHGELRDVVGHDTREPDRDLRPGCGLDHRRREQCHHHDRSGGERVDRDDNGELPFGCKQIATAHSFEWSPRDAQQLITTGDRRVEQRSDNREKRRVIDAQRRAAKP